MKCTMKRILSIITLFIAAITLFTKGNCVTAQTMATENPYSPWNKADDTGEYYMVKCDSCGFWITAKTKSMLEIALEEHKRFMHPSGIENNDSIDNTDTICPPEISTENNYTSVVNIYSVATALQHIGICNQDNFIGEYIWLCGDFLDNYTVTIENICDYIHYKYGGRSDIPLSQAFEQNYSFLVLAKPNTEEESRYLYYIANRDCLYYKIITNYNYHLNNTFRYGYVFIF